MKLDPVNNAYPEIANEKIVINTVGHTKFAMTIETKKTYIK